MNARLPASLPAVGDWWCLPTGRTVSIRCIEGVGFQAEITARYVDENGAKSTGEIYLSINYVVRGRKVGRD